MPIKAIYEEQIVGVTSQNTSKLVCPTETQPQTVRKGLSYQSGFITRLPSNTIPMKKCIWCILT